MIPIHLKAVIQGCSYNDFFHYTDESLTSHKTVSFKPQGEFISNLLY